MHPFTNAVPIPVRVREGFDFLSGVLLRYRTGKPYLKILVHLGSYGWLQVVSCKVPPKSFFAIIAFRLVYSTYGVSLRGYVSAAEPYRTMVPEGLTLNSIRTYFVFMNACVFSY